MVGISQKNINQTFNELSIELTKKCILDCIYCSSEAGYDKEDKLDLNILKKIVIEVKNSFQVNTISLSGGESFLYPQFLEFYNFLKKERMKIIVYTSGIIVDHYNKKISIPDETLCQLKIESNNPKIILNIQGYNKNSIEKINGIVDSFEIIKSSIENIYSNGIILGANIVPFKENYKNIEKIYAFCLENKFTEINFLRFVPQGRGHFHDYDLETHEFIEVQQTLLHLLKRNRVNREPITIRIGHPLNFLFLLNQGKSYKNNGAHYCRGGLDAPLILPNGDVAMCPAWKELSQFCAGNIYEQNFDEIWNSSNFELFRHFIKESYNKLLDSPCKDCNFLQDCRGKCVAQRLLSQGDKTNNLPLEELLLHASDPQCFKKIGNGI